MFLELNKVFPELRNTSPEARLLSEVSSNKELFLDDQPEELLGHRCELVQTRSIQCKMRNPTSSSQQGGPCPRRAAGSNRKVVHLPRSNIRWLVNRPNDRSVQGERSRVKTSEFQGHWKHRSFCTQMPIHRADLTQSSVYTQPRWHTEAFTHRSFYTQKSQRSLYT